MSYYGGQTHCETFDSVSQLEIGQTGYLLKYTRTLQVEEPIACLINVIWIDELCTCLIDVQHARIQKVFLEGVHL